tara:strand:- start:577 stop:762 length:186 start_codon:yes stop_codon:yes gene_type:complete
MVGVLLARLLGKPYIKSQVPPPTKYQAPVGRDNYLGIGTMKIKKGGSICRSGCAVGPNNVL